MLRFTRPARPGPRRTARRWHGRPCVKELEARTLLSAAALDNVFAQPLVTPAVEPQFLFGYTPAQIKLAYSFNGISFNGVAGDGTGVTIAIVDAYHDPKILHDVTTFDAKFGLPDFNTGPGSPTLTEVDSSGGTNYPTVNSQWAAEISLDVEWAHAMAPGANILLVDATTAGIKDMLTAIKYAAANAQVVSMSWGANEYPYEVREDSVFATPGVTFVAAAGDSGPPALWPSVSPNVLSVGGTTLKLTSSGGYLSETGWNQGGGGPSAYESQPAYQTGVVTQSSTARTTPDVAYDANLNTGYAFYDTVPYFGLTGWNTAGGTSGGAPQWAAIVAIADQGRALLSTPRGTLSGGTQTLPTLYGLYAAPGTTGYTTYTNYFHDVSSGGNKTYTAAQGYDLVTGLGSPIARRIVTALVHAPAGAASPVPSPGGTGQGDFGGRVRPADTLPDAVSAVLAEQAISRQTNIDLAAALIGPSAPPVVSPPLAVSTAAPPAAAPVAATRPATVEVLAHLSSGYGMDAAPGAGLSPDGAAGFGDAPAVMPRLNEDADNGRTDASPAAPSALPTLDAGVRDEAWDELFFEAAVADGAGSAGAAPEEAAAGALPPDPQASAVAALATALVGGYLRVHTPAPGTRQRRPGRLGY